MNPVNRCQVAIVPTEDIERFEREFVSLITLAVGKKELEAVGVSRPWIRSRSG
ncbi:hypothetical protein [Bradyrhizobium sp. BR 1432]|uniref:hypothetical protein n=1 Tax=Bradyrhizobium sp. BR 1432 TaxID=3447966 RepID=UPI003EE4EC81